MALNGVNFALAFTGQEYIWQKLFLEIGLSQDEVDDYFTGPAFLAWNRMSNIEKLYGPLAQSFIEGQRVLGRQINQRMKQLGIKRISPGFSGHLPGSFKRIAPNATLIRLPNWAGFNDSFSSIYLLDPRDAMFVKIGAKFTAMYNEEFGTDHYYNVDLFNEMTPPTRDLIYLANSGKAVFDSLIETDPLATWVMQGWLFHHDQNYWQIPQAKALITSVPLGKLIVLDLYSESYPQFNRLNGYFGVPFIWCMLLNFGGVSGMFGNLHLVNQGVHAARANYSNMLGIGITPEGIENNDIMYDFMLESPLRSAPTNLTQWVINFAARRYGIEHQNITNAWLIYASTVYNETSRIDNHGRYELTSRPSLKLQSIIWYDVDLLEIATGLMYSASNNKLLRSSETFKYDYVNSVRQWLQVLFSLNYKDFVKSFHERDVQLMVESSGKMLDILKDMEKLLKTDPHFSLGNWLSSAASWASSDKERVSFVEQAKNQLTLWGYNGEIIDYAAKQWSGLVLHYYIPRWQLFFNLSVSCIQSNCSSFNQNYFNSRVLNEVEKPFTRSKSNIGYGFTSGFRLVTLAIKDPIASIDEGREWAIYSIESAISVASAVFEGSNFKYRIAWYPDLCCRRRRGELFNWMVEINFFVCPWVEHLKNYFSFHR